MNTVFDDVTSALPIHSGIDFFFILKLIEFMAVACIRHHDVFVESLTKRSYHSTNHTFVRIAPPIAAKFSAWSQTSHSNRSTNLQRDTIPLIYADNTQNWGPR